MILVKTFGTSCSSQFQNPVVLFRIQIIIEKVDRIYGPAIYMYFIVTMWSGRFTGAAYPAYYFATAYFLTVRQFYLYHMSI